MRDYLKLFLKRHKLLCCDIFKNIDMMIVISVIVYLLHHFGLIFPILLLMTIISIVYLYTTRKCVQKLMNKGIDINQSVFLQIRAFLSILIVIISVLLWVNYILLII